MDNHIRVGIGVIIVNDGKILLGHYLDSLKDTGGIYEPGSWTLPGGKLKDNETVIDCIIRETKEESNLDISEVSIFNAADDFQPSKHFVSLHAIAKSFDGELKVMEGNKIDEWCWFPIDNLPVNIYSPSRKCIDNYLKKEGLL